MTTIQSGRYVFVGYLELFWISRGVLSTKTFGVPFVFAFLGGTAVLSERLILHLD